MSIERRKLINKLAYVLPRWPEPNASVSEAFRVTEGLVTSFGWSPGPSGDREPDTVSLTDSFIQVTKSDYLAERERLINKPIAREVPPGTTHIAQWKNGVWLYIVAHEPGFPKLSARGNWIAGQGGRVELAKRAKGAIPAGHRWQGTLERIKRTADDTCTPEEEAAWREMEASLKAKTAADRAIQEEAENPTPSPEMARSAILTLEGLGYAYNGGQLWKPPIGPPPAYILTDAPAMDWDTFYLGMAQYVATKSKDPSTGVGAVIVRPDRTVAALGFNGFPRNAVDDTDRMAKDRNWKLARMIHAEVNAIINAKEPLDDCTLYVWPMPPCSHCAAVVAQAGIALVVAPEPSERWLVSCNEGRNLLYECGVGSDWR